MSELILKDKEVEEDLEYFEEYLKDSGLKNSTISTYRGICLDIILEYACNRYYVIFNSGKFEKYMIVFKWMIECGIADKREYTYKYIYGLISYVKSEKYKNDERGKILTDEDAARLTAIFASNIEACFPSETCIVPLFHSQEWYEWEREFKIISTKYEKDYEELEKIITFIRNDGPPEKGNNSWPGWSAIISNPYKLHEHFFTIIRRMYGDFKDCVRKPSLGEELYELKKEMGEIKDYLKELNSTS